jgi:phosphate-selective porin OprO/OprP
MKLKQTITLAATVAGMTSTAFAVEISDADFAALKKQLADLDQKVRILEREREIDTEAATTKSLTAPKLTLGANGFSFSSGDSNFVAQLHGVVQFDNRSFFNDGGTRGNDGFLIRRARPIFSGTIQRDFDYLFMPDFGGNTVQIQDAYLTYRYSPEFQLQAGKFKSPIGLEHLQADPNTLFNERSLATALVPNRDLGLALKGDLLNGVANYTVGVFNGAPDFSGSTTNLSFQDNKAIVGRVFFQPWKNSEVNALRGFGFGAAGSYENDRPATNAVTGLSSGFSTDGQQRFFAYNSGVVADGVHWRFSPQAYYYYGPLGLLAEYVVSDQKISKGVFAKDVQNTAWNITGSWLLTGEEASYGTVNPRHPFDPRNGQWGAFQIVARYASLDVDDGVFAGKIFADPTKSASGASAWSVGLNWYLNKNIRANASFSHTVFDGYTGGKPAVAAQDENVFFTRLQLAF